MHQWSNEHGTDIVEHQHGFTVKLYELLEKDHHMLKHSDKSSCDSYEMPLCETTKTINSEVLSNMSNLMAQMIKMMQEKFEALPPRKADVSNNMRTLVLSITMMRFMV
ncbi:hypothetical protein J1N35_014521 [Gossypium stocksii]|uniref:Uncharacterized protein n=1 Tax=Gossypium stocksii TaxID=47602 RepID=A0A9D3VU88_9ROSI|nr:hypothetical protein J1N35_014521 [Gossypium stocksii]